ncbi:helix-turn-helix domain-containing protein [Escherichia coli]|nr:helix-turn-helix domain-containing protein [Escherichia coli]
MTEKKTRYGMNFTPIFDLCMKYKFKKPIRPEGKKKLYTLNLLEAYIYGLMCNLHYNGCEIFISQSGLAEKIGCDVGTVRLAIKTLINAGVIKQKHRYGKSNLYTLLITPEKFANMCAAQGIEEDAAVAGEPEDIPEGYEGDQEEPEDTTQEEDTPEEREQPEKEAPEQPETDAKPLMKRHRDEYGYCELTRDEMNKAYFRLKEKYRGKKVKLSTLRDEIYGPEYMTKYIIGTHEGTIWREESYWHCTKEVFQIVNRLIVRGNVDVEVDKTPATSVTGPSSEWYNVRETRKEFIFTHKDGSPDDKVMMKQLEETTKG